MRFYLAPVLVLSVLVALGAVASDRADPPPVIPEGRVVAGQTLFVEKGCYQCHSAGDIRLPEAELDETLIIELGGKAHAAWTRDDFARAILDPHHTVSPDYEKAMMILGDNFKAVNSPMPGFNDILTASDLIHLTTFLTKLSESDTSGPETAPEAP
ncbi:MAG: hypothetical protein WD342_14390 [Verrucomicrobiales bacterium]